MSPAPSTVSSRLAALELERIATQPEPAAAYSASFGDYVLNAGITLSLLSYDRDYSRESIRANPLELQELLMRLAAAHEFSERLSRRITFAHQQRRQAIRAGQPAAPGLAPSWLELGPAGWQFTFYATTVRRVLELTAEQGAAAVARLMNAEGIPSPGEVVQARRQTNPRRQQQAEPRRIRWTADTVQQLVSAPQIHGARPITLWLKVGLCGLRFPPSETMPPDEPTPADFTTDLAAIEHRQALLHAALAQYQAGIGFFPDPKPLGAHGLAYYHRLVTRNDGSHSLEAVLLHEGGGEISSGLLPVDSCDRADIFEAQRITLLLVVGETMDPPDDPKPQQSQKPRPIAVCPTPAPVALPLQQEPPAAAEPEPEPNPEPTPAPAPPPAADEPPTKDEISALIDDLDRVFNRRPTRVKELTAGFRTEFEIGPRTPVAKAITTRDRLDWLRAAVNQLLQEIAEFDQPSQEAA